MPHADTRMPFLQLHLNLADGENFQQKARKNNVILNWYSTVQYSTALYSTTALRKENNNNRMGLEWDIFSATAKRRLWCTVRRVLLVATTYYCRNTASVPDRRTRDREHSFCPCFTATLFGKTTTIGDKQLDGWMGA